MSAARAKGTRWETAIVDFLRARGALHAERRAGNGIRDRGDIAGLPGIVIEAKSHATLDLAGWLAEAEMERAHAGAALAVVWHKRRSKASAGDGYVTMSGAMFAELLRQAGHLGDQEVAW